MEQSGTCMRIPLNALGSCGSCSSPPPGLGVLQVDLTAGATLGEMAADLGATQFTGG